MILSLADYGCFSCADYQPDKDRDGGSAVVEKEWNGTRLFKNKQVWSCMEHSFAAKNTASPEAPTQHCS